ncbi:MAG: protein jag [Eubacteriales bacterium]|nr:protein jag [Eubacteriales bacterium]
MDFSEKWGTSVEIAVDLALKDLGLARDDVEVIVLEEPTKGFFGIGSKLAKVRVLKKKTPVPEKVVAKTQSEPEVQFKAVKPAEEIKREEVKAEEVKPASTKDRRKQERKPRVVKVSQRPEVLIPLEEHPAIDFVKELIEKMGLNLEISAERSEDCIYIDIKGKDSGSVIGKRGQTLDAIQYLTSLVANKEDGKHTRIVVDAENYRAKREMTLAQLAERLANKVIKTKRSVRLEPMNPYERKVIHATLQGNPGVKTRSEGEEPYRRVIIELK